jgi:hypothetical protein
MCDRPLASRQETGGHGLGISQGFAVGEMLSLALLCIMGISVVFFGEQLCDSWEL